MNKIDEIVEREFSDGTYSTTFGPGPKNSKKGYSKDQLRSLLQEVVEQCQKDGGFSSDLPLTCNAHANGIDMRIGNQILQFAAENHPQLVNRRGDPLLKITDITAFAKCVVEAINRDDEDGATKLALMLDEAIDYAVSYAADGIDYAHFNAAIAAEGKQING